MSPHELKEICTLSYQHESIQPFSIKTSPSGVFAIMTKTALQIVRPEFKFNPDLNVFNLKPFALKCPQGMPTNELDTEEQQIYNSADRLKRESLLLDQRYLPKLSSKYTFELIQSRMVAWNSKGLLAYLSSYGGLEIYHQTPGENEWESILDVGSEYLKYLTEGKTFPLKTMNELESLVHDILLTSICFCQIGSQEMLIAMTKSNKIVTFQIDIERELVKVASVSNLSQHNVIVIKPILIPEFRTMENHSYLVGGSMDGQICMYKVNQSGDATLQSCLWNDKDLLAVTDIKVLVLDQGLLVIGSKAGHLVGFKIDSNMNCTYKTNIMISSMPITGTL